MKVSPIFAEAEAREQASLKVEKISIFSNQSAEYYGNLGDEDADLSAFEKAAEEEGRMDTFDGRRLFMPIVNLFKQRKGFHPVHALRAWAWTGYVYRVPCLMT